MSEQERQDDLPPNGDALNVPVRSRRLPEEVKQKRWIANAARERREQVVQQRLDDHVQVYGMVLDAIEHAHTSIADDSDLDLGGDTRQAAVWIVAGRCIGYGRSILVLVSQGFGGESAAQMRAAHEATRLLSALADHGEPALLRQWLDDEGQKWVRPKQTRAAGERMRVRLRETMVAAQAAAEAAGDVESVAEIEAGLQLEAMSDDSPMSEATRSIYDVLSRIAHTRRSGVRDAVAVPLRQMATGPHPDPLIRADYVFYAGQVVEEITLMVGSALGQFYGPGWFSTHVKPLVDRVALLRTTVPIDSSVLAAMVP